MFCPGNMCIVLVFMNLSFLNQIKFFFFCVSLNRESCHFCPNANKNPLETVCCFNVESALNLSGPSNSVCDLEVIYIAPRIYSEKGQTTS